jgi:putative endonuclease
VIHAEAPKSRTVAPHHPHQPATHDAEVFKDHRIMPRSAYVYILASGRYGTLYIGVTSDLIKRIWQHREGLGEGFTKRHQVKYLVWYEVHGDIMAAITREKQLKEWRRAWKLELIHEHNPLWRDLYLDLV